MSARQAGGPPPPEDGAMLQAIAEAIDAVKGRDTVVFDVRGFEVPTSYMVITSGETAKQLRAIRLEIEDRLGAKPFQQEGADSQQWMVADYGSVIVHIMSQDARAFYELDELWDGTPVALEGVSDGAVEP